MLTESAHVGVSQTEPSWLTDTHLTCRAKGVLSIATDLAVADQPITVQRILARCSDSKSSVINWLWQLVADGYLTRHERSGSGTKPYYEYRFATGGNRS